MKAPAMSNSPPSEPEPSAPPLSPDSVILLVDEMDSEQVSALAKEIKSFQGFNANKERCQRLAPILRLKPRQVRDLLGILEELYEFVRDRSEFDDGTEHSLVELLSALSHLPKMGDGAVQRIAKKLAELVDKNPNVERLQKLKRLRAGLGRNAVGFDAFVDLRPDFSPDRSSIREMLPLVQVRVRTDAKAKFDRQIVFQITPEKVDELARLLADIKQRLECLKKQPEVGKFFAADSETIGNSE